MLKVVDDIKGVGYKELRNKKNAAGTIAFRNREQEHLHLRGTGAVEHNVGVRDAIMKNLKINIYTYFKTLMFRNGCVHGHSLKQSAASS